LKKVVIIVRGASNPPIYFLKMFVDVKVYNAKGFSKPDLDFFNFANHATAPWYKEV
jgi:hypothetical protein